MWPVEAVAQRGQRAQELFIVIGEDALAWVPRSRNGKPCGRWQQLPVAGGEPGLATLDHVCRVLEGLMPDAVPREIKVVVADLWLAQAVLPWHAGATAEAACQRWVRRGLLACGHQPGEADLLRWDEAAPGMPRLCLVYPVSLWQALQRCAQRLAAPLRSVLPLSILAWQGLRGPAPTLVVAGRRCLLLARGHRAGQPMHTLVLRRRTGQAPLPAEELMGFWQRLVLRDPALARVERIALLDLAGAAVPLQEMSPVRPAFVRLSEAPMDWLADTTMPAGCALDAVAPPAWTRSPWHWCACVLALVAVGLLVQALRVRSEAESLAYQAAALRQAQLIRHAPAQPVAAPERVLAVNRGVAQLNLPVEAILRALAPPPDIVVALTSLEWDQANGNANDDVVLVGLSAAASSAGEMMRYVAFLEHQPRVSSVALRQHESQQTSQQTSQNASAADGLQWRFVVQLAWRATP